MKANKLISIFCAVSMMVSAGAMSVCASAETGTKTVVSESDGIVPEALYDTDGLDEAVAEDSTYVISGEELRSASASDPAAMVYVTFRKLGSFELFFDFTTAGGAAKRYTVLSNRTKDYVAYIPLNDVLDALHITADDVKTLTVSGTSIADVSGISLNLAAASGAAAAAPAASSQPASHSDDENPGTGVEGFAAPLALAGFCCTAAIAAAAARRRK